eukprot:gnl/Dysnectes_brevis/3121_a3885_820.p1 GENE.gnl/Dysnectes_brevis/3121_a3885_820~~gnl/Dysnectes_brevis/3121_a3885_820.p1  ORF type:complete len:3812 (-),score=899.21 gnl/Dysnectes_brevis/3121_a3885_820:65-11500(-)
MDPLWYGFLKAASKGKPNLLLFSKLKKREGKTIDTLYFEYLALIIGNPQIYGNAMPELSGLNHALVIEANLHLALKSTDVTKPMKLIDYLFDFPYTQKTQIKALKASTIEGNSDTGFDLFLRDYVKVMDMILMARIPKRAKTTGIDQLLSSRSPQHTNLLLDIVCRHLRSADALSPQFFDKASVIAIKFKTLKFKELGFITQAILARPDPKMDKRLTLIKKVMWSQHGAKHVTKRENIAPAWFEHTVASMSGPVNLYRFMMSAPLSALLVDSFRAQGRLPYTGLCKRTYSELLYLFTQPKTQLPPQDHRDAPFWLAGLLMRLAIPPADEAQAITLTPKHVAHLIRRPLLLTRVVQEAAQAGRRELEVLMSLLKPLITVVHPSFKSVHPPELGPAVPDYEIMIMDVLSTMKQHLDPKSTLLKELLTLSYPTIINYFFCRPPPHPLEQMHRTLANIPQSRLEPLLDAYSSLHRFLLAGSLLPRPTPGDQLAEGADNLPSKMLLALYTSSESYNPEQGHRGDFGAEDVDLWRDDQSTLFTMAKSRFFSFLETTFDRDPMTSSSSSSSRRDVDDALPRLKQLAGTCFLWVPIQGGTPAIIFSKSKGDEPCRPDAQSIIKKAMTGFSDCRDPRFRDCYFTVAQLQQYVLQNPRAEVRYIQAFQERLPATVRMIQHFGSHFFPPLHTSGELKLTEHQKWNLQEVTNTGLLIKLISPSTMSRVTQRLTRRGQTVSNPLKRVGKDWKTSLTNVESCLTSWIHLCANISVSEASGLTPEDVSHIILSSYFQGPSAASKALMAKVGSVPLQLLRKQNISLLPQTATWFRNHQLSLMFWDTPTKTNYKPKQLKSLTLTKTRTIADASSPSQRKLTPEQSRFYRGFDQRTVFVCGKDSYATDYHILAPLGDVGKHTTAGRSSIDQCTQWSPRQILLCHADTTEDNIHAFFTGDASRFHIQFVLCLECLQNGENTKRLDMVLKYMAKSSCKVLATYHILPTDSLFENGVKMLDDDDVVHADDAQLVDSFPKNIVGSMPTSIQIESGILVPSDMMLIDHNVMRVCLTQTPIVSSEATPVVSKDSHILDHPVSPSARLSLHHLADDAQDSTRRCHAYITEGCSYRDLRMQVALASDGLSPGEDLIVRVSTCCSSALLHRFVLDLLFLSRPPLSSELVGRPETQKLMGVPEMLPGSPVRCVVLQLECPELILCAPKPKTSPSTHTVYTHCGGAKMLGGWHGPLCTLTEESVKQLRAHGGDVARRYQTTGLEELYSMMYPFTYGNYGDGEERLPSPIISFAEVQIEAQLERFFSFLIDTIGVPRLYMEGDKGICSHVMRLVRKHCSGYVLDTDLNRASILIMQTLKPILDSEKQASDRPGATVNPGLGILCLHGVCWNVEHCITRASKLQHTEDQDSKGVERGCDLRRSGSTMTIAAAEWARLLPQFTKTDGVAMLYPLFIVEVSQSALSRTFKKYGFSMLTIPSLSNVSSLVLESGVRRQLLQTLKHLQFNNSSFDIESEGHAFSPNKYIIHSWVVHPLITTRLSLHPKVALRTSNVFVGQTAVGKSKMLTTIMSADAATQICSSETLANALRKRGISLSDGENPFYTPNEDPKDLYERVRGILDIEKDKQVCISPPPSDIRHVMDSIRHRIEHGGSEALSTSELHRIKSFLSRVRAIPRIHKLTMNSSEARMRMLTETLQNWSKVSKHYHHLPFVLFIDEANAHPSFFLSRLMDEHLFIANNRIIYLPDNLHIVAAINPLEGHQSTLHDGMTSREDYYAVFPSHPKLVQHMHCFASVLDNSTYEKTQISNVFRSGDNPMGLSHERLNAIYKVYKKATDYIKRVETRSKQVLITITQRNRIRFAKILKCFEQMLSEDVDPIKSELFRSFFFVKFRTSTGDRNISYLDKLPQLAALINFGLPLPDPIREGLASELHIDLHWSSVQRIARNIVKNIMVQNKVRSKLCSQKLVRGFKPFTMHLFTLCLGFFIGEAVLMSGVPGTSKTLSFTAFFDIFSESSSKSQTRSPLITHMIKQKGDAFKWLSNPKKKRSLLFQCSKSTTAHQLEKFVHDAEHDIDPDQPQMPLIGLDEAALADSPGTLRVLVEHFDDRSTFCVLLSNSVPDKAITNRCLHISTTRIDRQDRLNLFKSCLLSSDAKKPRLTPTIEEKADRFFNEFIQPDTLTEGKEAEPLVSVRCMRQMARDFLAFGVSEGSELNLVTKWRQSCANRSLAFSSVPVYDGFEKLRFLQHILLDNRYVCPRTPLPRPIMMVLNDESADLLFQMHCDGFFPTECQERAVHLSPVAKPLQEANLPFRVETSASQSPQNTHVVLGAKAAHLFQLNSFLNQGGHITADATIESSIMMGSEPKTIFSYTRHRFVAVCFKSEVECEGSAFTPALLDRFTVLHVSWSDYLSYLTAGHTITTSRTPRPGTPEEPSLLVAMMRTAMMVRAILKDRGVEAHFQSEGLRFSPQYVYRRIVHVMRPEARQKMITYRRANLLTEGVTGESLLTPETFRVALMSKVSSHQLASAPSNIPVEDQTNVMKGRARNALVETIISLSMRNISKTLQSFAPCTLVIKAVLTETTLRCLSSLPPLLLANSAVDQRLREIVAACDMYNPEFIATLPKDMELNLLSCQTSPAGCNSEFRPVNMALGGKDDDALLARAWMNAYNSMLIAQNNTRGPSRGLELVYTNTSSRNVLTAVTALGAPMFSAQKRAEARSSLRKDNGVFIQLQANGKDRSLQLGAKHSPNEQSIRSLARTLESMLSLPELSDSAPPERVQQYFAEMDVMDNILRNLLELHSDALLRASHVGLDLTSKECYKFIKNSYCLPLPNRSNLHDPWSNVADILRLANQQGMFLYIDTPRIIDISNFPQVNPMVFERLMGRMVTPSSTREPTMHGQLGAYLKSTCTEFKCLIHPSTDRLSLTYLAEAVEYADLCGAMSHILYTSERYGLAIAHVFNNIFTPNINQGVPLDVMIAVVLHQWLIAEILYILKNGTSKMPMDTMVSLLQMAWWLQKRLLDLSKDSGSGVHLKRNQSNIAKDGLPVLISLLTYFAFTNPSPKVWDPIARVFRKRLPNVKRGFIKGSLTVGLPFKKDGLIDSILGSTNSVLLSCSGEFARLLFFTCVVYPNLPSQRHRDVYRARMLAISDRVKHLDLDTAFSDRMPGEVDEDGLHAKGRICTFFLEDPLHMERYPSGGAFREALERVSDLLADMTTAITARLKQEEEELLAGLGESSVSAQIGRISLGGGRRRKGPELSRFEMTLLIASYTLSFLTHAGFVDKWKWKPCRISLVTINPEVMTRIVPELKARKIVGERDLLMLEQLPTAVLSAYNCKISQKDSTHLNKSNRVFCALAAVFHCLMVNNDKSTPSQLLFDSPAFVSRTKAFFPPGSWAVSSNPTQVTRQNPMLQHYNEKMWKNSPCFGLTSASTNLALAFMTLSNVLVGYTIHEQHDKFWPRSNSNLLRSLSFGRLQMLSLREYNSTLKSICDEDFDQSSYLQVLTAVVCTPTNPHRRMPEFRGWNRALSRKLEPEHVDVLDTARSAMIKYSDTRVRTTGKKPELWDKWINTLNSFASLELTQHDIARRISINRDSGADAASPSAMALDIPEMGILGDGDRMGTHRYETDLESRAHPTRTFLLHLLESMTAVRQGRPDTSEFDFKIAWDSARWQLSTIPHDWLSDRYSDEEERMLDASVIAGVGDREPEDPLDQCERLGSYRDAQFTSVLAQTSLDIKDHRHVLEAHALHALGFWLTHHCGRDDSPYLEYNGTAHMPSVLEHQLVIPPVLGQLVLVIGIMDQGQAQVEEVQDLLRRIVQIVAAGLPKGITRN